MVSDLFTLVGFQPFDRAQFAAQQQAQQMMLLDSLSAAASPRRTHLSCSGTTVPVRSLPDATHLTSYESHVRCCRVGDMR